MSSFALSTLCSLCDCNASSVSASVISLSRSPIKRSIIAITPVFSSDLVAYAFHVAGGGEGAPLSCLCVDTCDSTVIPVPAIPLGAAVDAVLRGQLHLRRGLVELRIVELVQPILGKCKHFFGSCVRCHQCLELCVLLLPLFRRFSNRFVQSSNACIECFYLLSQSGQCLFCSGNCRFRTSNAALQGLLFVVRGIKLRAAVFLLVLIVILLLL